MNKNNIFYIMLIVLFFVSCNDMHDVERDTEFPENSQPLKMLVLSEGLFNQNDSKLAFYDFENKTLNTDYFGIINKRGLGDTANDMILYGSKLYILVNVSSQIEILDIKTGRSVKQIPLFNEKGVARQPRYAVSHEGKVYITCFDGTLQRIDTVSMTIDAHVTCGRNPEGLCVAGEKIYVANSGGLDFPNYDNTVSVIDIRLFKELKKIKVGTNPYRILSDTQGDVYVSSRGNYGSEPYRFQRIDTYIDEVAQEFTGLNVLNFTIFDDRAYLYSYNFSTNENWIKVFDCLQEKVVNENFISDGTKIITPYSIQLNPYSGDVYITDAHNFTIWGDVLCFSPSGKLKFSINQVGLNPNKIIFTK